MDVICLDRTDGRLFFAADFLTYLNDSGYQVGIVPSSKQADSYPAFLRHFPHLRIMDAGAEETAALFIIFTDTPRDVQDKNRPPRTLFFPLIPREKKSDWNRVQAESVIPLGDDPYARRPVCVGEYLSACDMLERAMGRAPLQGKRLLVSAGPTAEDMDPVRFITNRSSGKMGIAVARAAYRLGARVTLVLGPALAAVPPYLKVIPVRSAEQMASAVLAAFPEHDAYIAAAAVADFTPQQKAEHKIKKSQSGLSIQLKRTTDILEALKQRRDDQLVVGFSMETENLLENSLKKLKKKNLDWIAANDPTEDDAGFAADTNTIVLINRQGEQIHLPKSAKLDISERLLRIVFGID